MFAVLLNANFKAHFPPSPVGDVTSSHELMRISVVVGGNTYNCSLGMTTFWESFPHVLESMEGARRYISAFRAPLKELSTLSPAQIHTLRACSLLVIPPLPERVPPQGGFPTDLSELNLSSWAALVQDVAAGLQALPPNLGRDMSLPAVSLLQLLETSMGLGFCRYCYHVGSKCICMGTYQPTPPQSWSQIVEQTQGYGVTASSGGMTTSSTTVAEMSG